jgi:predicted MPP superfamily phosphohydrolase
MKILTIGDIHGLDIWKMISDFKSENGNYKAEGEVLAFPENYDLVIYMGDYTDSFTVTNVIIKRNLLDIIEFKKKYGDKVILLLGNHDLQYYFLGDNRHLCSGFRPEAKYDLHDIFKKNDIYFQAAFQIDNYLWTHAGVHTGWYEYRFKKWLKEFYSSQETFHLNLADQLNEAFEMNADCLFDVGRYRGGFRDVGGPFWMDRFEGYKNPLKGYHQIAGHTRSPQIKTYNIDDSTSITFVDVLEDATEGPYFYELE